MDNHVSKPKPRGKDARPVSVNSAYRGRCLVADTTLCQVATRRTRTAGKVEIPNVDDHVSKLEHMGKETVKKLQDLRGAAMQVGLEIHVPDNCINKGAYCLLRLCASQLKDLHGHPASFSVGSAVSKGSR